MLVGVLIEKYKIQINWNKIEVITRITTLPASL